MAAVVERLARQYARIELRIIATPLELLRRELYERRHELGVEIVGFIDPDKSRVGTPLFNPGIIGTIDDIPAIVREHTIDKVVVSLTDAAGNVTNAPPVTYLLDTVAPTVATVTPVAKPGSTGTTGFSRTPSWSMTDVEPGATISCTGRFR